MAIEKRTVKILGILATIWGTGSKKVYIYLHGQRGNKEEASLLASIVCAQGWQVVSFDLPQHGERTQEEVSFVPWHIIPELHHILRYVKQHWTVHALFANSIGAWFSMLSFANEKFSHGLFVSPILDMKYLMSNLMQQADVTEKRLQQEQRITTSFGQSLSWEYWTFIVNHPIIQWKTPTSILYAKHDPMISLAIVKNFSKKFHCDLHIIENADHWFHTPEQIEELRRWITMAHPR